jgi:hypothetical protein
LEPSSAVFRQRASIALTSGAVILKHRGFQASGIEPAAPRSLDFFSFLSSRRLPYGGHKAEARFFA